MKLTDKKILLVGALFLFIGVYMDLTQKNINNENRLERGDAGTDPQEYSFQLDAEDVLEEYEYRLSLEAQIPEEETIAEYFAQAKQEIEEHFCGEGEEMSKVTCSVNMEESYVGGLVTAEWFLDNYEVMDLEGNIIQENATNDGTIVTAAVELYCYEKTEWYQFAFVVYSRERNPKEQLIFDINQNVKKQLEQAGEKYLILPSEINGIPLRWSFKKQHYFIKILVLELFLGIGLVLMQKERIKNADKKKKLEMKLDYPEIVSKILILCGAGMSIQESWNKISARYLDKRNKKLIEMRIVYEEMVITGREIMDGESENVAWIRFGERMGLRCYRRFGRLLAENQKKGAKGFRTQLENEAEEAFQERKNIARKLGEEAGTKLLMPMILMLGIVIAIVIMPVIVGYSM